MNHRIRVRTHQAACGSTHPDLSSGTGAVEYQCSMGAGEFFGACIAGAVPQGWQLVRFVETNVFPDADVAHTNRAVPGPAGLEFEAGVGALDAEGVVGINQCAVALGASSVTGTIGPHHAHAGIVEIVG
jgi:hypothetical protein